MISINQFICDKILPNKFFIGQQIKNLNPQKIH
jgi:hypothetical protein